MKLNSPLVWLGAIIIVLGLYLTSAYNGLIGLEENVDNALAKVETQYQRRMDLIPNVVATVQGAANFEQTTLQNVVAARSAWANATTTGERINAAGAFDSALSRLLVTVEAYPQLKATEAFRDLTTELEGTENRVAFARNEWNDVATTYNKTVRTFPRNLIAKLFSFDAEKPLFAAAEGSENAPKVNFGATTTPTPATAQ